MAFHNSTQRKFWLFSSPSTLVELRKAAMEESQNRILKATNGQAPGEFLTPEEEATLHCYYLDRLGDMAKKSLKKVDAVRATAIMYYKRFYLNNSVLDHPPKETMLTCLFLACKSEDMVSTMDDFVRPIKKGADGIKAYILQHELMVVEQLNFQLQIHHPFHAIEGLCVDALEHGAVTREDAEAVAKKAVEMCNKILVRDVTLLYPPSHLALSCVLEASTTLGHADALQRFFHDTLQVPDEILAEMSELKNFMVNDEYQDSQVKAAGKKLRQFKAFALRADSTEYHEKCSRNFERMAAIASRSTAS